MTALFRACNRSVNRDLTEI